MILQKNEIEELNERLVSNEETYNGVLSKYSSQIQQLQVQIEKLFYENQSSSHLINKLKRELTRLKSDLNFLSISHSLKDLINENPLNVRLLFLTSIIN